VILGKHLIGPSSRAFIIAEVSGNHNGSLDTAMKILREAKKSGADAIKLQTYTPDTITLKSDLPDFKINKDSSWAEYKSLWDLFESAYTPWEWHPMLFEEAHRLGMEIFSSPFDESAVDFLEELNVVAYKVASPEINHIPLLEKIGMTKKPVIVSTGLATLPDIELAISTLVSKGSSEIALLKCTTRYPAPDESLNLKSISSLREKYNVEVGFSDHSEGWLASAVAVASGASIIEKHFKIENTESVDSFFSLDEKEFESMVKAIRKTENYLGSSEYSVYGDAETELKSRRSLYVSAEIKQGEMISPLNIKCVRPGFGLPPFYYSRVLGLKARKNLTYGMRLNLEDLE
jgi:N-acetylneuraminate synthase/pseudaminic acid synthase